MRRHSQITLLVILISCLSLSFKSMAQATVSFNGKDQYLSMTKWQPKSKFKVVAWLGNVAKKSHSPIYLLSDSQSDNYISYDASSAYVYLNQQKFESHEKLNFAKTRFIEITVMNGKIRFSDGQSTTEIADSMISTGSVRYDESFRAHGHFSKGSLQSLALIDLKNTKNSRTIAFTNDANPVVIAKKNTQVDVINRNNSSIGKKMPVPTSDVSDIKTAEQLMAKIVKHYKGRPIINQDPSKMDIGRVFAWEGYYWIRTYINLYKATNDTQYLKWGVELSDFMFEHTDQRIHIANHSSRNKYKTAPKSFIDNRRKIAPGWSQEYIHNGVTVLVDGMILNGIMRLVDTIKEHEVSELYPKADLYISKAKEIINSHNSSWSETKQPNVTGSWYYTVPKKVAKGHSGLYSNPLPYNHSFAMASAMLIIDKWSGGYSDYRSKINKYVDFFANQVQFHSDGTCTWNYTWEPNGKGRSEDINHGHIDVGFIALADKYTYLPSNALPKCMAATVVKNIAIGPGAISNKVDGSGITSKGEAFAVSYDYRDLAKYEPSIIARSDAILRQFINLTWFRQYAALSETLVTPPDTLVN